MSPEDCIQALGLPESTLVDQRVPKKTLAEHGATTATARRQVQDGVEELRWIAALKPSTCGISPHADTTREYLEIAVLHLALRPVGKPAMLLPLIHRAIPYPVVLVSSAADTAALSLVHKRWSQAEKDRVVVDGDLVALPLDDELPEQHRESFLSALALAKQPQATLYDLYQGWLDTILAMRAAALLGDFRLPRDRAHAAARDAALRECERLESEMASLRAAAVREKQFAKRAELNLELRRLAEAHASAREQL
ncbi:MAG: DUF4391 domain-containing protein [Dehalococcoidia bacterium]